LAFWSGGFGFLGALRLCGTGFVVGAFPEFCRRVSGNLCGERRIVLGASACGSVLEDRLPETWTFGQSNVPANPRLEYLRVGTRGISFASALEKGLQIVDHFATMARASVIKAKYNSSDFQIAIDAFGNQIDSFQEFGQPMKCQEMGLKRNQN